LTKIPRYMNLVEAVCRVDIKHDGDEKYVVLHIYNEETAKNELWFVSYPVRYHSHIVHQVQKMHPQDEIEVYGGGIVTIERNKKTLRTYGMSGGYGPPNLNFVKRILNECLPDFQKDLKVTEYVRD